MTQQVRQAIIDGRTSLGIELGSTRIKAVLIDEQFQTIASGSFEWEARDLDLLTRGDLARTASQLPRVGAQHPTAIRGTFDDDRQYRFFCNDARLYGF